jgi:hypothetical protein
MNESLPKIKGGKFSKVEGDLCLALSSRNIRQEDINTISSVNELSRLLFYYAIFEDADLSVLKKSKIKHLSILHGNFSNIELKHLKEISSLKSIKLLDTKVTNDDIDSFKSQNPSISFK